MVSLVSIILTDLVPLRDVAVYRSYVNIVQTVGRSCGGPVGGWVAQTIGWRWAFLCQAPLTVIAMLLVAWKLDIKPTKRATEAGNGAEQHVFAKLKRVDFMGSLFLSSLILSAMLIIDMGGDKVSWTSPVIPILAIISIVSGVFFYFTEKRWAKEPIFPLRLLSHKVVVLDYAILGVQVASQLAVSSLFTSLELC
jgi:MFS family permease